MRGPKARLNATAVPLNQAIASGHAPRSENWVGREIRIALAFLPGYGFVVEVEHVDRTGLPNQAMPSAVELQREREATRDRAKVLRR